MPLEDFSQFGFGSGVFAPELHGSVALENYDIGLKAGRNFTINYLGGAFVRGGTRFTDYVQFENEPARIIPFRFNRNIGNNYCIILTKNRIRFVQDGQYVLEAAKTIVTLAPVLEVTAHGFSDNDWVQIAGETYQVDDATVNTFTIRTPFGTAVDLTGTGATSVARIYTLAHSFDSADFFDLKFDQLRDVYYINHPNYTEKQLTRFGDTNWTLTDTQFVGFNERVDTVPSASKSANGNAGVMFAVAAVNAEGEEAPLGTESFRIVFNSVNYSVTEGSIKLTWNPTTNATAYNIYRSLIVPDDADISFAADLGYIGTSIGPEFTDNNITPDFSVGPLEPYNPFADAPIQSYTVTAAGSAYSVSGSRLTITGGQSGDSAKGLPIVDDNGSVLAVRVLDPGFDYVSPGVTVTGPTGSGAAITATVGSSSGNNPGCSKSIQQRRVRGGTNNRPNTIYGSRPGFPNSYFRTQFSLDDDPYELSIEAAEITPILHIEQAPEGMFVFFDSGVDLVRGVDDSTITTQSAKRTNQTTEGSSNLRPLRIGEEVLYVTADKDSVQAIGKSNLPTYFTNRDRSVFSSHYFTERNPIIDWGWAKAPDRLIWAVRADGTLLSCAYEAQQQVNAWTDHTTKGLFKSVAVVRENTRDVVYTLVQRRVNNTDMMYLEQFQPNMPLTVDEMWAVDSGLQTALIKPAANIDFSAYEGTVTVTASDAIFTSGDVGKHIRAGRGRGTVTTFISETQLTVRLDIPIHKAIPELDIPPTFSQGEWSLNPLVTTITGLGHLEGQSVAILADGGEQAPKTVTNASITLDSAASFICVGLNFTGECVTLPIALPNQTLESMKKRPYGIAVRLLDARGLQFGDAEGDRLYSLPARGNQTFGVAPEFANGTYQISIRVGTDLDGSIRVAKTGPFSGGVLGLVRETNLGPS